MRKMVSAMLYWPVFRWTSSRPSPCHLNTPYTIMHHHQFALSHFDNWDPWPDKIYVILEPDCQPKTTGTSDKTTYCQTSKVQLAITQSQVKQMSEHNWYRSGNFHDFKLRCRLLSLPWHAASNSCLLAHQCICSI